MQSVRLLRSRSGTSALPRHKPSATAGGAGAVVATPPSPDPLSSKSPSSGQLTATFRSKSATKDRSPAPLVDCSQPPTAALRRASKENCRATLPDAASARPKQKATPPSAWALSPGRSPLRASTVPTTVGRRKASAGLISPWARSPGRPAPTKPAAEPPRPVFVAAATGKKGGTGGRMLGLFRRKKESAAREDEEASHQLRMLASRLAQWRFANARAVAAMEATRCNSEEKVFHVWLKIYELRNLVAAKRILIQRRKQRLKMVQVLNPQLHFLCQWEPQAKKHSEAVAMLGKVLGAATVSLPLVQGAQADLISIHQYISIALEIMNGIASSIGEFYTTVKEVDSKLCELVKTTMLEIEGLEQIKNMHRRATAMEMHELSLMGHLIQAAKEEDESIACSQHCAAHITEAYIGNKIKSISRSWN